MAHLGALLANMVLIPPLNRRRTDMVCSGQFSLSNTTIMRFKNFQPIGFRRTKTRANSGKGMTEVSTTTRTMVFGHPQVQGHHLIAQARVLNSSVVGSFNLQMIAVAIGTGRSADGLCPHLYALISGYPFNL
ncbi:MAG: hypothetical protein R3E74_08960 [Pseudomonadales bacterium]